MEVNLEPSNLLKYRGNYKTSNHFKSTRYNHSFKSNEGKFLDNSQKVGTLEFKRETNLSIEGFLAGLLQSPLIMCFSFQAFQVVTRSSKLRAFSLLIFCASSIYIFEKKNLIPNIIIKLTCNLMHMHEYT